MAVTARRFTVDEVLSWPDDGNRYELVDGILLVTPAPVPIHQIVATRLAVALSVRLRDLPGIHVANPGAILIRPDLMMEPDVLVFRAPEAPQKWEQVREHWLAVEVFSPSSMIYDREVKRDAYLQVGVGTVWLVDAEQRTVYVSQSRGAKELVQQSALQLRLPDGSELASIELTEIFAGLA